MPMHNPAHPGMLLADLLESGSLKTGSSLQALAEHIAVPEEALESVLKGAAPVTAALAVRLEAALGVEADLWLRLQNQRDLWEVSQMESKPIQSLLSAEAA